MTGIPPSAPRAPRAARATLVDVATAAGTSASTVSRVLHGGAGVTDELSERVRRAARELGYSVNRQARTLRRGKDTAIGVACEDFTIPFFGRIVAQVERAAHERGYGVVITCAGAGRSEEEAVEPLLSRSVAGLVVATGTAGAPEGYLAELAAELPVVQVDAPAPSASSDTVGIDNEAAGRLLTEHLIAHGHRRILFVGSGPAATTVEIRRRGYEAAMRAAGLEPVSTMLGYLPSETTERAVAVLRELTDPGAQDGGITAVLSGVARVTMGLASAMAHLGLRDLAFAAIDDLAGADAFSPPLTVLEQDVEAIGARAAQLLFARIDGDRTPPVHEQVPLKLIVRGSGELPPRAPR
ncbi:transcriptional regulator, LacI family [Quadrisphaera granulorum]|uniref:LacI family transcriptional regulator n=1 Tax=Quadrisphaera granulorum TaxID=317664 RepID=A0A316AD41_9ACTN|nr:LacI family DNA-binding transcriptional regulator [Quadrisphaera granulorum]PWJ55675.1 LacI family transcriptional regulator [Quadrisphaera granulorum]SZE95172.1 transcriptional regulator, LacI family [Quadrisphaera granulorum]